MVLAEAEKKTSGTSDEPSYAKRRLRYGVRKRKRAVAPEFAAPTTIGGRKTHSSRRGFRARVNRGLTSEKKIIIERRAMLEQHWKHDQRGGQGNPWSGCRDFENAYRPHGTKQTEAQSRRGIRKQKREAKKAVARAKEKAYEDLYKRFDSKEGENDIYRIAKARDRRKRDLGNVRFIKDERIGKALS
ncbi:hypothetical protein Tco_1302589 [Tanacetum coccineum]